MLRLIFGSPLSISGSFHLSSFKDRHEPNRAQQARLQIKHLGLSEDAK